MADHRSDNHPWLDWLDRIYLDVSTTCAGRGDKAEYRRDSTQKAVA